MTAVGKTVRVARSVVTDLKIDGDRLYIGGIDQDKDNNTLAHHSFSFTNDELPANVGPAVDVVRKFAQDKVDEA